MYKHLLILPDGTQLFSGTPGQAAIRQVTVTRSVNSGEELTPGCVSAALLEAQVLIPGAFSLQAGDTVQLWRIGPDGSRSPGGIFILEKPERAGTHLYRLTGYDRVSLLDRDLTAWLEGLGQWPYTLEQMAQLVCARCGLELEAGQLPNGEHPVQRFSAAAVTGRQLMQWICQACCRFCYATEEGKLRLGWYQEVPLELISPGAGVAMSVAGHALVLQGGDLSAQWERQQLAVHTQQLAASHNGQKLTLTEKRVLPYRSGGLSLGDYTVAPVRRVQIRQNREDVGTVYPAEAGEKNTYILQGNPLLSADHAETLRPVAQTIYEILSRDTYTPGTVKLSTDPGVQPGQILTVQAPSGPVRLYVMQCVRTGQVDTLSCTGSPTRACTIATNGSTQLQLQGRVLELQTDVDGLRVENRDTAGNLARLSLDVTGLRTQVSHREAAEEGLRERLTQLEQSAQGLQLQVQSIQHNGTDKVVTGSGYSFTDTGLNIRREGEQMENLLDHTGMYVRRAGEVLLQANKDGVVATDVQVRNYLVIGSHSRLEDYRNEAGRLRTACFRIGG